MSVHANPSALCRKCNREAFQLAGNVIKRHFSNFQVVKMWVMTDVKYAINMFVPSAANSSPASQTAVADINTSLYVMFGITSRWSANVQVSTHTGNPIL